MAEGRDRSFARGDETGWSPESDVPPPASWAAPQEVWGGAGDVNANRGPDHGWAGSTWPAREACPPAGGLDGAGGGAADGPDPTVPDPTVPVPGVRSASLAGAHPGEAGGHGRDILPTRPHGGGAGGHGAGHGDGPGGYGYGAPSSYWQPSPPRRAAVGLATLAVLLAVAVLAGIGIGRSLPGSGTTAQAAGGLSGTSGSTGHRTPGGNTPGGSASGVSGAGAGTGTSGGAGTGAAGTGASGPPGTPGGSAAGAAPSGAQVAAAAARITPALVDVDTALGYAGLQAAGTGIILTSDGLVLTNNHVVSGETSLAVVDLATGHRYTASVVGYDVSADVAVIRIHGASGLRVAPIAAGGPRLGEQVVAVGNAGGRGGKPTAAGGTITGLDRSITASDQGVGTTERLSGLIQTSADIQLGDSGGSLIDTQGRVVGVDTAAAQGFSFSEQGNMGFAIPIRAALAIARRIEAGRGSGAIHVGPTAFIGVRAAAQSCAVAPGAASVPAGSGAVICSVLAGTPAARSALRAGDLITAVGGRRVGSPTGLTHLLIALYRPGDRAVIAFLSRYGKGPAGRTTVTLGSGPPG
ncbi:MAG: S1C family serine protease [Acidimicrobiales bacterium]